MTEKEKYVSPTTKKEKVSEEERCDVLLTTGLRGRRCAQPVVAVLTNPHVKKPQKVCAQHLKHFLTPIWTVTMLAKTDRGAG